MSRSTFALSTAKLTGREQRTITITSMRPNIGKPAVNERYDHQAMNPTVSPIIVNNAAYSFIQMNGATNQ